MFKYKNVLAVLVLPVLTMACGFVLTATASANSGLPAGSLGLVRSSCHSGPEQFQELALLKNEIAAAGTVHQARALALTPTEGAIGALKTARTLMPLSDDLRIAETRLSDTRSRILVASSQEQVADEFSGMMLAGLDNDSAAHVSIGGAGCNYSTGETIAIVIGLILGIIPGLILMVLLC